MTSSAAETRAGEAILRERKRQTAEEGYTAAHDDEHGHAVLRQAALAYERADVAEWPWDLASYKPTTHIGDLVKAGALALAAQDVAERADEGFLVTDLLNVYADDVMTKLADELDAAEVLS